MRGGFVEITGTQVTILAEEALPVEELNAERLDQEVLTYQMLRDAAKDEVERMRMDAAIGRLEELKGSLRL